MKGSIYKISHRNEETGVNDWPGYCYIGQTRQTKKDRWNQHRNAGLKYAGSTNSRKRGKHARLYEAMSVLRVSNFEIEILAEYASQDENELVIILQEAEANFIEQYDSIAKGWNAKKAVRSSVRNTGDESLYQKAKDHDVAYNSLRHRTITLGEPVGDAIKHLEAKKNRESLVYLYKRQSYKTISEIAESKIHNPNELNKKTIEQRIRKFRERKQLHEEYREEENQLCIYLLEEIFAPTKVREISVKTPDGDIVTGTKKDLHSKLRERFPNSVPKTYQTIIARLNKPNWSNEQAFGFDYPPDLLPIKHLVELEGYSWANGKAPDFVAQDGKPVVLHQTKEIFSNQTQFADTYGLPVDMVSDFLNVKKITPEALLKYKGLTP